MGLLQQIIELDHRLFFLINQQSSNAVFDVILPFTREAALWAPLYLFLLVLGWLNFGTRGLLWAIAGICVAALCDIVSSHIIKEFIFRWRPCCDPLLAHSVTLRVIYCPQNSSFTSSHATSHFGMAAYFYFSLKKFIPRYAWLFYMWALIISYAQVYVGVHFPLDVLCGGIIGFFIGYGMYAIFNNKIGFYKTLTEADFS
jgi:membrane-associated phospholipid phosphatase